MVFGEIKPETINIEHLDQKKMVYSAQILDQLKIMSVVASIKELA